MITKQDVMLQAVNQCMNELYSLAQPLITMEDFKKECEEYNSKYHDWERFRYLFKRIDELTEEELKEYSKYPKDWENKNIVECIGPKPYEFYYLPSEIYKEIVEDYVYAYELDKHQDLLDTIKILKDYCESPVIDKYINATTDEFGNHHPGYRGYDHPDNLKTEIIKIITEYDDTDPIKESNDIVNKFFEFLDMAGKFFNWNSYLNSFYMSVYLGAGPSSNKQEVIDNWEKYRNQKIEIDDDKFNKEQDYD